MNTNKTPLKVDDLLTVLGNRTEPVSHTPPIIWEDTNSLDPLRFMLKDLICSVEHFKHVRIVVYSTDRTIINHMRSELISPVYIDTEENVYCIIGIMEDQHIPGVGLQIRPLAGVVYQIKDNRICISAVLSTVLLLNTVFTAIIINAVKLHAKTQHPDIADIIVSHQYNRYNQNIYLEDKKTINIDYITEIDKLISIKVD